MDEAVLVVLVVDEVAVGETVEVSTVDKVAVDEVSVVDGSFDVAAEKRELGIILNNWSWYFVQLDPENTYPVE